MNMTCNKIYLNQIQWRFQPSLFSTMVEFIFRTFYTYAQLNVILSLRLIREFGKNGKLLSIKQDDGLCLERLTTQNTIIRMDRPQYALISASTLLANEEVNNYFNLFTIYLFDLAYLVQGICVTSFWNVLSVGTIYFLTNCKWTFFVVIQNGKYCFFVS